MKFTTTIGFLAAVLILLLVGFISTQTMARLTESQQWVAHTYDVRYTLLDLAKSVADATAGRRAYYISHRRDYLRPQDDLQRAFPAKIEALRKLMRDNGAQQKRLDAVEQMLGTEIALQRSSIESEDARPSTRAVHIAQIQRNARFAEQLERLINDMTAEENRLLDHRLSQQKDRTGGAIFVGIVGVGISITLVWTVIFLLVRQVRERARAEEELKTKSGILHSILDSMADGVVVADAGGRILHFNAAAAAMIGEPTETPDLADWSRRFRVFYPDAVTPYPEQMLPLRRAMAGEQIGNTEIYVRREEGGGIWLDVAGAPLRDEGGDARGGVIVMRDNTQRRKAEEEINRLNSVLQDKVAALEATNRELESFSYSVSHDLRSPLRSIDGFSQALLEDYGSLLDEQGKDFLTRVRSAAQRMGRLIDDMLVLSRVTRRELVRSDVDLSGLAVSVLEELQCGSPEREVETRVAAGITAPGDAHLLRAVLENLLGNAWKFTSKSARARIEFGVERMESGEWACCVRDNGAGFDPAYAHKLFGAFQRLHAMEEFPGTGIGLATVQRILLRHGGRIWGEGEEGKGAAFFFVLPGLSVRSSPAPRT